MILKLILTWALAICANATVLKLRTSTRIFEGEDLLGKYELFVKQGKCPQSIQHLNYTEVPLEVEGEQHSAYAILHGDIIQQGTNCSSIGQFAIVPNSVIDAAGYREALGEAAPVVDDLHEQKAEFLVGVELAKRECGDTYLSKSALSIFIEQEKKVRVPGLISLYPGAKYIVIYEKDSPTPCTYFQPIPGRTIGQGVGNSVDEQLSEEDFRVEEFTSSESTSQFDEKTDTTGSDESPLNGVPLLGDSDPTADSDSLSTEGELSPEESPDASSSACFPGDAHVILEKGILKRMDEIEIGDRVLVGDGLYSEVFMFTHRLKSRTTEFVEIFVESGLRLQLTEGHYLYANNLLKTSGSVTVGETLYLSDGTLSKVERIRRTFNYGLYNPQTIHGDIVVNGVVTSTYTKTVYPSLAHSLLAPLRSVFQAIRFSTDLFDYGLDNVGRLHSKGT